MIVLRTPKGWTGPKEVDGHKVEGFWRAHQVPVLDVQTNPEHLQIVEEWMRSYKPEELFDEQGTLIPELRDLPPKGERRMSANPHANGGKLRKPLDLPDFRDFAIKVEKPGATEVSPTATLAKFLCEVMRRNMTNFRIFSPDENASNKLDRTSTRQAAKTWLAEIAARRRRRHRDRSRRPRDGDAQRTHPRRLAGRLPAHRPPRPPQYL